MFSYDCMRILLMMLDCAVVHSTAAWVSNSLKGHPFVCNLGLQSFKGTYLGYCVQSLFIGVRFFKAEICPGSHSLRGYQWSLKDSGVRVGARIARGIECVEYNLTISKSTSMQGNNFEPCQNWFRRVIYCCKNARTRQIYPTWMEYEQVQRYGGFIIRFTAHWMKLFPVNMLNVSPCSIQHVPKNKWIKTTYTLQ